MNQEILIYQDQNQVNTNNGMHLNCRTSFRKCSQEKSTSSDSQSQHTSQLYPTTGNVMQENMNYYNYCQNTSRFYGNPQNSKYKIQLCRNFMNNGYCPYNEKCQYAHGRSELRYTYLTQSQQILQNPEILEANEKYKTKKCKQFFKKGYCVYGETCNYLHSKNRKSDLQDKKQDKQKITDIGFKEIINEAKPKSRLLQILQQKNLHLSCRF